MVLFAGEAFPIPHLNELRKALSQSVTLSNLYGPTETNVCTFFTLDQNIEYIKPLPIGVLCNDFKFKIIDEQNNEVNINEQGELVVNGPHLMKGYWNRADLNSRAFVQINGVQYYKTGDFVKLLPNHNLSFLGRKDRQVKIRGFRVELDLSLIHI